MSSFFRSIKDRVHHHFSEPSLGHLFADRQHIEKRPVFLDLFIPEFVHAHPRHSDSIPSEVTLSMTLKQTDTLNSPASRGMLPKLVTTGVTNDDRGVLFLRVEIIHKIMAQERGGRGYRIRE